MEAKAKYMYVEMILKHEGKESDVVGGMFKGIIEARGRKFMAIEDMTDTVKKTNLLNIDFYDLLMVEFMDKDYKSMLFLTNEDADQKAAMKVVEEHYKSFMDAGMGMKSDEGIIDVNLYTDVPTQYKNKPSSNNTTLPVVTNSSVNSGHKNTYTANEYSDHHSYTKPKEKEPFAFKATELPNPKIIEEMVGLMKQIADGTLNKELPPLEK